MKLTAMVGGAVGALVGGSVVPGTIVGGCGKEKTKKVELSRA